MLVCDKLDMVITCAFCDLHFPFMLSGFLQKDLFKRG